MGVIRRPRTNLNENIRMKKRKPQANYARGSSVITGATTRLVWGHHEEPKSCGYCRSQLLANLVGSFTHPNLSVTHLIART